MRLWGRPSWLIAAVAADGLTELKARLQSIEARYPWVCIALLSCAANASVPGEPGPPAMCAGIMLCLRCFRAGHFAHELAHHRYYMLYTLPQVCDCGGPVIAKTTPAHLAVEGEMGQEVARSRP